MSVRQSDLLRSRRDDEEEENPRLPRVMIDNPSLPSVIDPARINPLVEHGRRNIESGGAFRDDQGLHSILSTSVQDQRLNAGKPTVIPSVYEGRALPLEEAIERAVSSGIQWPSAETEEEATLLSQRASSAMNQYLPPSPAEQARADGWWELLGKSALSVPYRFKAQLSGLQLANDPESFRESAMQLPEPNRSAVLELADNLERQQAKGVEGFIEAQREIERLRPNVDEGTLKYYSSAILEGALNMVPALTVGILTKNPAAASMLMGSQVFGEQYADSVLNEGRTHEQATMDALFMASTEVLTEMIPLGILTKLKAGQAVLPRILKATLAEGTQEMITEGIQMGYDKGVLHPDEEITWGEALRRIRDAGIIGAGVGGSLGAVTAPLQMLNHATEQEIADAIEEGRSIPDIVERVNTGVRARTEREPEENPDLPEVFTDRFEELPEDEPLAHRREPEEDIPEFPLSAVHNLTSQNLLDADKMGGMPLPSVAVIPEEIAHTGYGDVTLIGTRDLVDPEKTPVFDADAYTGRMPRAEYPKVRMNVAQPVVDRMRPFAERFDERHALDTLWDNAVNNPNPEETIRAFMRPDPGVAAWFLKENYDIDIDPVRRPFSDVSFIEMPAFREYVESGGTLNPDYHSEDHKAFTEAFGKAIDQYVDSVYEEFEEKDREVARQHMRDNWISDGYVHYGSINRIDRSEQRRGTEVVDNMATSDLIQESLKGKEKEFAEWVQHTVMSMYQEPYVQVGRRRMPYTLDNITDRMLRDAREIRGQEETMTYGPGKARAAAATRISDLIEMRNRAEGQIRPEEEVNAAREEVDKLMTETRDRLVDYYGNPEARGTFGHTWEGLDAAMRALSRWANNRPRVGSIKAMRQALRAEDFHNVPDYMIEEFIEAGEAWLAAPVPYFEAKPQRSVSLDEFPGAVIPDDAPQEIIDLLERRGIQYQKYSTEGDREFNRTETLQAFRRELAERGESVLFHRQEAPEPATLEQGLEGEEGYLYHATNEERLREIAESGSLETHEPSYGTDQEAWPDGSTEARSYFMRSPENLYQFAPEEGRPVVIRAREDAGKFRRESTGDIYSREALPTERLEYLGRDSQWHPLPDLLATARAQPVTESPQFKKWFGDSVVTENGQPQVVYRGDRDPITDFNKGQRREPGLFFSDSRDYASFYGDPRAFYMRMENPLDLRRADDLIIERGLSEEDQKTRKFIVEELYEPYFEGRTNEETGEEWNLYDLMVEIAAGNLWRLDGLGGWSMTEWRRMQEVAPAYGYDGIIVPDGGAPAADVREGVPTSYIVFDGNQVKLTTAEEFSTESSDIRASRKPTRSPMQARKPTEAQKEAGNYKKGKQRIEGLDISIETPAGRYREGPNFRQKMRDHYGYVRGTKGADGEQIDVFTKKGLGSFIKKGSGEVDKVHVVNQMKRDGKSFDEHKVIIGAASVTEARSIYRRNFGRGWNRTGSVLEMPIEAFREWIKAPQTTPLTERDIMQAARKAGVEYVSRRERTRAAAPDHGRDRGRAPGGRRPGARQAPSQAQEAAQARFDSRAGKERRKRAEHARRLGNELRQRLPRHAGLPPTFVVADWDGLPKHLRDFLMGSEGAEEVTALFDPTPGRAGVYLIASEIQDADTAFEHWAHEMVGHHGLRTVLGPQYGAVMDEVAKAFPEKVRDLAKRYRFDYSNVNQRRVAAEEFVAHTAQKVVTGHKVTVRERSFLERVLDLIRNLLRRLGIKTKWTEKQLMELIKSASNYVWNPSGYKGEAASLNAGFRRHERPPTYYSQLYKAMTDTKTVPESSTIAEYKRIIENKIRKGEIKAEEARWVGIDDFDGMVESVLLEAPSALNALRQGQIALPENLQKKFDAFIAFYDSYPSKAVDFHFALNKGLGNELEFDSEQKKWIESLLNDPVNETYNQSMVANEIGLWINKQHEIGKLRVSRDFILDTIRAHEVGINVVPPIGEVDESELPFYDVNELYGYETVWPDEETIESYVEVNWDDSELESRIEEALEEELQSWEDDDGKPLESIDDIPENDRERVREQVTESYRSDMNEIAFASAYEDAPIKWTDGEWEIWLDSPNDPKKDRTYNVVRDGKWINEFSSFTDARDHVRDVFVKEAGTEGISEASHWAQYTLPGGTNYRERLFKWTAGGGVQVGHMGSHFSEDSDFIVHARFDERKTADGKKALFVDEIQSDWHQFNRDQTKNWEKIVRDAEEAKKKLQPLSDQSQKITTRAREAFERILDLDGTPIIYFEYEARVRDLGHGEKRTADQAIAQAKDNRWSHGRGLRDLQAVLEWTYGTGGSGASALFAIIHSPTFRKMFAKEHDVSSEDVLKYAIRQGVARMDLPTKEAEKAIAHFGAAKDDAPIALHENIVRARRTSWQQEYSLSMELLTDSERTAIGSELAGASDLIRRFDAAVKQVTDVNLELAEARKSVQAAEEGPKVVPAPFENDYMVLVSKWMIQEAVRQGFDTVLFAPGTVHGKRWHSTQTISEIGFAPISFIEGESGQNIRAFGENGIINVTREEAKNYISLTPAGGSSGGAIGDNVHINKLHHVVGRKAANAIKEAMKKDRGKWLLTASELGSPIWYPVGAAGSRQVQIHMGSLAIYDEIYVNKINKFLKKYKAKLVPGEMDFGDRFIRQDRIDQNSAEVGLESAGPGKVRVIRLDISPELKDAANNEGFPLFHRRDLSDLEQKKQAILNGDSWHIDEGSNTQRWWNYLVFQLQDKFEGVFRAQDAIKSQLGATIPDELDAYLKEEMYHSRVKYRIDKYDEEFVDPLIEMIKKSGYSWDDVEMYLYARHAPEANARLAKINKDSRYNSGMTDEEAAEVMAVLERDGDISKLHTIGGWIDRMTQHHRETLVSEGLEKQEVIDAWEATYDHYIPLKGLGAADDAASLLPPRGRGYDVGGSASKARLGRTTRADSILANIVAAQQSTYVRAEKSRVGRALLALAERFPNDRLWKVDQVKLKRYMDKRTGLVTRMVDPMYKFADNVLRVKIDGEDHTITFNERNPTAMRMVSALKNMSNNDVGLLLRGLHTMNRFLSALNTSLNPEFVVSNFARDIQTAFVNLSATDAEGAKKKIMKNVFPAMRGIARYYFKKDRDSRWAKEMDAYRKTGGQVGWIDHYKDVQDLSSQLQKRLDSMDSRFVSWDTVKTFFDTIEKGNLVVENAVRLSAFAEARRLGMTDERAASLAKNLTVNFNRKGNSAVTANSLYLFFNASIQGAAVIWNAAKHKKARRWMYGIVAFAGVLEIVNRTLGGEDDDGEWRYDKIEESVKERNLIVMLPEWMQPERAESLEDYYFKVPLPYGYNVLHTIGRKVGGYLDRGLIGNKREVDPINDAMEVILSALHSFNPIGTEATISQTLSPTITDPLIQIEQNKAWHGGPIVPEEDPFDPAPKPMSERYFRSVSEPSRWLARELNRLGGGTETRPSQIPILDTSPEVLDHIQEFFTGGAGRFIMNMTDLSLAMFGKEEVEMERIPFIRRVVGKTGTYQIRDRYYDIIRDVEYADKELEAATENGDGPRIDKIWQDYGTELRMRNEIRSAQQFLRNQRTQRRAAEQDEALPEDERKERVEEIEDLMDRRMDEIIQRFNEEQDQDREQRPGTARAAPFINGRTREEAIEALESAGFVDTAKLLAALPKKPRKPVAEEMRRSINA